MGNKNKTGQEKVTINCITLSNLKIPCIEENKYESLDTSGITSIMDSSESETP
jgi:hypothetical protein